MGVESVHELKQDNAKGLSFLGALLTANDLVGFGGGNRASVIRPLPSTLK